MAEATSSTPPVQKVPITALPIRTTHEETRAQPASGTASVGVTTATHTTAPVDKRKTSHPLSFGLAFVGGLGVVLMIVALGIGVVQGADANTSLIGVLFVAGLLMMVSGIGAWVAVTQPFAHFDDINVPKYTGHAHDSHDTHEDTDSEHATEREIVKVTRDEHGHPIEVLPGH